MQKYPKRQERDLDKSSAQHIVILMIMPFSK